ncbi:fumarylacetoacetate hydrolase family protein [Lentzea sp. E54]|uniref:fumarylacetoacetate hydrolase family protein n=1 Tax=Lentzea xerophila TaxID=3435883 RepID=UPI003DA59E33
MISGRNGSAPSDRRWATPPQFSLARSFPWLRSLSAICSLPPEDLIFSGTPASATSAPQPTKVEGGDRVSVH